ncbi:mitochondrial dynamin GTPase Msp1 [Basidiobolus ranarum]|uniref:dynamin GTPase n=1 Tax=Basidiobolus ranarum TaxID=34480 RepID=A0ABR2W4L1_9FUNG
MYSRVARGVARGVAGSSLRTTISKSFPLVRTTNFFRATHTTVNTGLKLVNTRTVPRNSLLSINSYANNSIFPKSITLHRIPQRNASFTPIRILLKVTRIPLAFAGVGAGTAGYISYRVNELSHQMVPDWVLDGVSRIGSLYGSAKDKGLPEVGLADFFSNLFITDEQAVYKPEKVLPPNIPIPVTPPIPIEEPVRIEPIPAKVIQVIETPKTVSKPQPPQIRPNEFMLLTKKLIEIRNLLKGMDGLDIQLPSIVVIGSQSSGKSSVLESIVGREFLPKGNNMVTRRPLELTLVHTPDSDEEYGEFPQLGMNKVVDFQQIQQTLTDLNLSVPESQCVSNEPIELKIHSPNVPDLTLIDLPGYIQVHNVNQPTELKQKIFELCESYIQEPNIILAVCPADVDLANSEALLSSRRVDPLGTRTIGVITKMDLVQPESGVELLHNREYPLTLGYMGVVCSQDQQATQKNASQEIIRYNEAFFTSHPMYLQNLPQLGIGSLRKKLMTILEKYMGENLDSLVDQIRMELEETRYQYKVQYNDRKLTPESYLAETLDSLKFQFKEFSGTIGKPEIRSQLRQLLEQRVMDLCAQMYWSDPNLSKLTKDTMKEAYWEQKLDACSSILTKSGLGRLGTQMIIDTLMSNVQRIANTEPFIHHPDAQQNILKFSEEILQAKYSITVDQVENTIKPYKYEVDSTQEEWDEAVKRSASWIEKEITMCEQVLQRIKKTVGKTRLRSAIKHLLDIEKEEERLKKANVDLDLNEQTLRNHHNPRLVEIAKEAIYLKQRAMLLKLRLSTIKSKKCRDSENRTMCPEVFLSLVSEKLVYTASMFIHIELLNEFLFQFPRELDNLLYYGLDRSKILEFAKQNPKVMKQLNLAERQFTLEEILEKLNYLTLLRQENPQGNPQIADC